MRPNRSRTALFAFAGLAAAAARGGDVHREEITVFAERAPLVELAGTQAVGVIGRDAIESGIASSLPEMLRDVAGVHVDRLGNAAGPSNVYIRGAEPNYTVVL